MTWELWAASHSPLSPLSPLSQLLHTYWPDHCGLCSLLNSPVSSTFLSGTSRLEPVTSTSVRESEGLTPGYDVWCLPLILVFAHSVNYARLACLNIIILLLITCSPGCSPGWNVENVMSQHCNSLGDQTHLAANWNICKHWVCHISCLTTELFNWSHSLHWLTWQVTRWQVILRLDIKLLTKLSTYDLLANIWIMLYSILLI